ncbi:hypothetical protein EDD18DRAFT_414182 [Armillaria luteobubalina]|uniref:TIP49 P-loop domain-containing protein n=1 Tax=Armillaria luteobubalina TaxID=153913 RepID=A0AA39NW79_9AGAR|nr:hypothetical protein EDD18DRAFT_414182 [Armillaria luteobubalina]
MVLKMARGGCLAGRGTLLAGSWTGKTAIIALGMGQTLSLDVSPTVIAASASDVFSAGVKDGAFLMEHRYTQQEPLLAEGKVSEI